MKEVELLGPEMSAGPATFVRITDRSRLSGFLDTVWGFAYY